MEEQFKVPMELYYLNIAKIKERDLNILKKSIDVSNLTDSLKFNSYANISFDDSDTKHSIAVITTLDEYTRSKTNCLIYDLIPNIQNDGYYDKLFIFTTTGVEDNYIGYLMYNTTTGRTIHKYLLENVSSDLNKSLVRDFNVMYNYDIYDYYLNRSFSPRNVRNNTRLDKNVTKIKSYAHLKEIYKNKYNKYFYQVPENIEVA